MFFGQVDRFCRAGLVNLVCASKASHVLDRKSRHDVDSEIRQGGQVEVGTVSALGFDQSFQGEESVAKNRGKLGSVGELEESST